jgi:hypothetical protein
MSEMIARESSATTNQRIIYNSILIAVFSFSLSPSHVISLNPAYTSARNKVTIRAIHAHSFHIFSIPLNEFLEF